ncbi:hypothetical protein [Campylobacter concisus]|uniref:hypothetical protein n=1 Tax=Campylobacter concisus TaxID=199 RepID=UPI000CD961D2|nr:hypothetical protein [Campylobacter concisus]
MMLETLSTNFVDFINYTFLAFSIMLLTTGMFLSYPFVRGEIEDEEKDEKEAMVFAIGLGISVLITLISLLVMIITPIYAMFNGINIIEFVKVAFSIIGYIRDNGDGIDPFLMLIIILVNFSVIAWIGGLITKFWGNKIFKKTELK